MAKTEIGICALEHKGEKQIVCPSVFPKRTIFDLIAKNILNCKEYTIYPEVKIGDNYLDYLMVDNYSKSNYCGIEFQALDTSGNYRWLFGDKVKPFCINWKTTKKTILSQLVVKSRLFIREKRKLILVVQKSFFDYVNFQKLSDSIDGDVVILSFDYKGNMAINYIFSSINYNDLLSSFSAEYINLKDIVNRTVAGNKEIDIL